MTTEEQDLKIPVSIKISFIIITMLFFVTLLAFSWVVADVRRISNDNIQLLAKNEILAKENKARITEIQNNRVEGCKNIYAGIRKVFKPFFPPAPRTRKQQADLDKFNNTIIALQEECASLVQSSGH